MAHKHVWQYLEHKQEWNKGFSDVTVYLFFVCDCGAMKKVKSFREDGDDRD